MSFALPVALVSVLEVTGATLTASFELVALWVVVVARELLFEAAVTLFEMLKGFEAA